MKSHYSDTTPAMSSNEIAKYEEHDGTWLFEGSASIAGAMSIVQAGFRAMYPDDPTEKAVERGWDVMSQLGRAWLRDERYPLADLATSYSTSAHAGQSQRESVRLLQEVMEFNRLCRDGWQPGEGETAVDRAEDEA